MPRARSKISGRRAATIVALLAIASLAAGCDAAPAAPRAPAEALPDGDWIGVSSGDLMTQTPYDGLVGPAGTATIQSSAVGTITRVLSVGATIHPGDAVSFVDEMPVIALPGDVPAFRDLLAPGAAPAAPVAGDAATPPVPVPPTAPVQGADVEQLQRFLATSGYFTGPVNGRFSSELGRSSRRWRSDHGMPSALGFTQQELLFIPGAGPWTVTKVPTTLGQAFTGGPMIEVSTGGTAVTVSLDTAPPNDATYAIEPAHGSAGTTTISLTAAGPATPSDGGKYAITLLPQGPVDAAIGTTVIVEQRQLLAKAVVTIPVAAVRLDASGKPVAHCRGAADGAEKECPLTLGATDGTAVEVRSGLVAGMRVAVSP